MERPRPPLPRLVMAALAAFMAFAALAPAAWGDNQPKSGGVVTLKAGDHATVTVAGYRIRGLVETAAKAPVKPPKAKKKKSTSAHRR